MKFSQDQNDNKNEVFDINLNKDHLNEDLTQHFNNDDNDNIIIH